MSCINCEDCKTYAQAVPVCDATLVGLATIPASPSTAFLVQFSKGNGGIYEETITSNGSGEIIFDPSAATVGADWFSPDSGKIKVVIMNAARTEQTFEDANATEATCALMTATKPTTDWADTTLNLTFQ